MKSQTELTESVIDSSLWQSEQKVREIVALCESDAERIRAIHKTITIS